MDNGFVQYLLDKGIVDEATALQALDIRRKRYSVTIGEIAKKLKLLTDEQIDTVLNVQAYENQMFGEIAVKLGYIRNDDIDRLLDAQKRLRTPITKILAEITSAPLKTVNLWYSAFLKTVTVVEYYCRQCGMSLSREQWEHGIRVCPSCGKMLAMRTRQGPASATPMELSPALKKIFISRAIRCPVCGIEEEFVYISSSAYSLARREIDLKPVFRWNDKDMERFHIPAFDFWQCANCSFSALMEYFEDPVRDVSLPLHLFRNAVKELFRNIPEARMLSSLLTEKENVESVNFCQAIKRALLSIYIYRNIRKIEQDDSLPLARTFLRLAWLYREINDNAEKLEDTFAALEKIFSGISKYMNDIPDSEEVALEKSLFYYERAYYNSKVPEEMGIEHNLLQVMGLLNIKSGRGKEGVALLMESGKQASEASKKTRRNIEDVMARSGVKKIKGRKYFELKKKLGRLNKFQGMIDAEIENFREKS